MVGYAFLGCRASARLTGSVGIFLTEDYVAGVSSFDEQSDHGEEREGAFLESTTGHSLNTLLVGDLRVSKMLKEQKARDQKRRGEGGEWRRRCISATTLKRPFTRCRPHRPDEAALDLLD